MANYSYAHYGLLFFSLFAFSYFVVPQSSNTAANFGLFKRSESKLSSRQSDPKYVALPVSYDFTVLGQLDGNLYADVQFGPNNQALRLAINTDDVTWVPELPASKNNFCSNSNNTVGCGYAGTSGYYEPGKTNRNDTFKYNPNIQQDTKSTKYLATGYWTENSVTVAGVTVDLQFGVATKWDIVPNLSLGLWSTGQAGGRPSYLQALEQQGKIAGQYCSCFNITGDGSIVLGGIDLAKFSGKLKIWDNLTLPGIVTSPVVRLVTGSNSTTLPTAKYPLSLVSPGSPFLSVPQNVLSAILSLVPAQFDSNFGAYDLPCDTQFDPSWFIEFTFDELVIKLLFQDLLSPITVRGSDRCYIALLPDDGEYLPGLSFSYILAGPFFRSAYVVVNPSLNMTALGVANRNITANNIVELGGTFSAKIADVEGTAPLPFTSNGTSPDATTSKSKKTPTGAIVGGVVGGIAVVAVILAAVFFYRKKQKTASTEAPPTIPQAGELPGSGGNATNELDSKATGVAQNQSNVKSDGTQPEYSELPSPHGEPKPTYSELPSAGPNSHPQFPPQPETRYELA
ncbi:Barrierpepsin [Dactylellina cionopaga]|nr:Barrierpepsin [Dactylellina cionopaga]